MKRPKITQILSNRLRTETAFFPTPSALLFHYAPNFKALILTALPIFLLWVSGLYSNFADGFSTWQSLLTP